MQIEPIAHIHTDFPTKFGVPRQSGLASELTSTIVFAPAYRNPDCLRGIADFSHLWLIWEFDKVAGAGWSPTVLPPKLGGKTRVGVFATRSPFRPNHMGLSVVRLASVDWTAKGGPVLYVTALEPAQEPEEAPKEPSALETALTFVDQDAAALVQAIGEPLETQYEASCSGPGDDGVWTYDGFTVYTYRENGVETIVDAE